MNFVIRDDEILLDVDKSDADVIMIALSSDVSEEYVHSIYLNKEQVFELIAKLVEMYGCMDES